MTRRIADIKFAPACDQGTDKAAGKFARTGHVMRLMERVAVAVRQQEPCLLVGETGTGKTALVQQLASQASSGSHVPVRRAIDHFPKRWSPSLLSRMLGYVLLP